MPKAQRPLTDWTAEPGQRRLSTSQTEHISSRGWRPFLLQRKYVGYRRESWPQPRLPLRSDQASLISASMSKKSLRVRGCSPGRTVASCTIRLISLLSFSASSGDGFSARQSLFSFAACARNHGPSAILNDCHLQGRAHIAPEWPWETARCVVIDDPSRTSLSVASEAPCI